MPRGPSWNGVHAAQTYAVTATPTGGGTPVRAAVPASQVADLLALAPGKCSITVQAGDGADEASRPSASVELAVSKCRVSRLVCQFGGDAAVSYTPRRIVVAVSLPNQRSTMDVGRKRPSRPLATARMDVDAHYGRKRPSRPHTTARMDVDAHYGRKRPSRPHTVVRMDVDAHPRRRCPHLRPAAERHRSPAAGFQGVHGGHRADSGRSARQPPRCRRRSGPAKVMHAGQQPLHTSAFGRLMRVQPGSRRLTANAHGRRLTASAPAQRAVARVPEPHKIR